MCKYRFRDRDDKYFVCYFCSVINGFLWIIKCCVLLVGVILMKGMYVIWACVFIFFLFKCKFLLIKVWVVLYFLLYNKWFFIFLRGYLCLLIFLSVKGVFMNVSFWDKWVFIEF